MKALTKYARIFTISMQSSLQYRGSVLARLIFYIVYVMTFFYLWSAVYNKGNIEGYTLPQIMWYLCLAELMLLGASPDVFTKLSDDIKTGDIAYPLTRPVHYIGFMAAQAMGETAFRFLTTAGTGFVLGLVLVGPLSGFAWYALPLMALSMLMGTLISMFLVMSVAFSAFYFEENRSLQFIYNKFVFMLGAFLPVEFQPQWLQKIVLLTPFPYIVWAPSRLAVAYSHEFFWFVAPRQLLWLFVAILLVLLVYGKSVKRLTAHGG